MKKLLTLFLALSFVVLITACNQDDEEIIYEINTDLTDALTLDESEYLGKTLDNDGIEVVTLERCVDGDTTHFRTQAGQFFSVRYLGIDTPESTGAIEPWGKAASDFVCDRLMDADTIVVELDDHAGRYDNHGRTLGYVWYDGRLLNLELIEQAYSAAQGVGALKYGDDMFAASTHARQTGRRIWGEDDPDYSDEDVITTLEQVVNNPDDFIGSFITIEGVIVRMNGINPIISDGEYELYVFTQYQTTTKVALGHRVRLERVVPTYHNGNLQLTNFSPSRTEVLETDVSFDE